jgi:hypothetical protein
VPSTTVRSSERPCQAQEAAAVSSQHYALFNNSFSRRLQAPRPHSEPELHTTAYRPLIGGVGGKEEGRGLAKQVPNLQAPTLLERDSDLN